MPEMRLDDAPRALVIGGGSIGERHCSVLTGLGADVASVSARTDLPRPTFREVPAALAEWRPDYIVVATETARHLAAVRDLQTAGFAGSLLIEKPLGFRATDLQGSGDHRTGVGFNLRFHPVLREFAKLIGDADVHTVEAYTGQALATWRPGRDPRNQYSAHRDQGGGVLRDLSHELDYLQWLFGDLRGVFARGGRVADVTVDSDDAWAIVAETERVAVLSLQVNYLDTDTRRRIVANTSIGTLEADLVAGTIRHGGEVIRFDVDRDSTYAAMHASMLTGGFAGAGLEDGYSVEQVVEMIETSGRDRRWVERS